MFILEEKCFADVTSVLNPARSFTPCASVYSSVSIRTLPVRAGACGIRPFSVEDKPGCNVSIESFLEFYFTSIRL